MQTLTWADIEAAKAAVRAVKEADNPVKAARSVHVLPKTGGLSLKQPTFHWKAADIYQEPWSFELNVKNIFMTNSYKIQYNKKVQVILNWLSKEELQFMKTLSEEEKKSKTSMWLFKVLSENFKTRQDETILPLQYCQLIIKQREKTEEWMGCLRMKSNECKYKEKYRRLQE